MPNLPGASRQWDPLYTTIDGMYEYKQTGLLCLPCMTEDLMDQLFDDFGFQEGDILVASYPQSGFLWLQESLWHMHHMDTLRTPIKDKDALAIRLPFLEHEFRNVEPMSLLKDMPSPRIMKTHLSYDLLKKQMGDVGDKIKVILWVQDPKTMLLNYHKFWSICGPGFGFPTVTWEKFFSLFQEKQLFEGDWCDMNRSWLDQYKGKDNLLVLKYEDCAKDLEGTVKKIAEFVDLKDRQKSGFKLQKVAFMQPYDKDPDWRTKMSEDQAKYVNELIQEKMQGTLLENAYTETS